MYGNLGASVWVRNESILGSFYRVQEQTPHLCVLNIREGYVVETQIGTFLIWDGISRASLQNPRQPHIFSGVVLRFKSLLSAEE